MASDIVRGPADSRMVSILPQGGDSGSVTMSNREASGAMLAMRGAIIALCLVTSACGLHWPWRHRSQAAPVPVHELAIEAPAAADGTPAAPIQQFWDRNTLLIDLTAQGGLGAATLHPASGHGWPVRLEFRVQPGRFTQLEVQAQQRVVFEVPAQGAPLVLRLAPGAYTRETTQITLRWSAADGSAR
jgi:hypothetical protein